MFDFLIELYLKEKMEYEKDPAHYRWTVENFFDLIEANKQFDHFLNTIPDEDVEKFEFSNMYWPSFYLAWAIKLVQLYPHPSASQPIDISFRKNKPYFDSQKYSWTALMMLGMVLPDKKFGSKAIYGTNKYGHLTKVDFPEEEGYFARFSSNSLYERKFKHLFKSDLRITPFLEATSLNNTFKKRVAELEDNIISEIINLNECCTDAKTVNTLLDKGKLIPQEPQKPLPERNFERSLFEYSLCNIEYGLNELPTKSDPLGFPPVPIGIDHQDREEKNTPLMLAVKKKKYRLAQLLLDMGANPLIRNVYTELASDLLPIDEPFYQILRGYELIYASHYYSTSLRYLDYNTHIRNLIEEGININFQGFGGYTALLIAIEQDDIKLIQLILSASPDLSITRDDGQGVFELVRSTKAFDLLMKYIDPIEEIDYQNLSVDEEPEENENTTSALVTETALAPREENSYYFFPSVNQIYSSISSKLKEFKFF